MPVSTPLECRHRTDLGLEEELAIAEQARGQGDWRHAVHHYVGALGIEPQAQQAADALRRLAADHDVLQLLRGNDYVGAHWARALLHAARGEHDDALEIATQVDEAVPDLGTVSAWLPWFDPERASPAARQAVLRRLAGAANVGIGRVRLLGGERSAVEPYAELAARLAKGETDPRILALASGLLRRAGRADEALAAAEAAHARGGDEHGIALGLALRVVGRTDEAAATFAKTSEATGDPTFLLEEARALADGGRHEDALQRLRRWGEVTQRQPDGELQLLRGWIEGRVAGDAAALERDYDWIRRTATGEGAILPMGDASVHVLDDPRLQRGGPLAIQVTMLESPSVRLTLAIFQGGSNDPASVDYAWGAVPTPDPRRPRAPVKTLLWQEDDGVMRQAVSPPPTEVGETVAEVAKESVDLFACWDAAGRLAPRVASKLDEVAAVMVYPPALPDDDRAIASWVYKCQVAAACLIARSDTRWSGSQRRQILLDVVRGPVDWTVAAAVLALGEVAVREPDALPEIRRELQSLAASPSGEGHCPFGATLAFTAAKIPYFRPGLIETLAKAHLEDEGPEEQSVELTQEAPPAEPTPTEEALVEVLGMTRPRAAAWCQPTDCLPVPHPRRSDTPPFARSAALQAPPVG